MNIFSMIQHVRLNYDVYVSLQLNQSHFTPRPACLFAIKPVSVYTTTSIVSLQPTSLILHHDDHVSLQPNQSQFTPRRVLFICNQTHLTLHHDNFCKRYENTRKCLAHYQLIIKNYASTGKRTLDLSFNFIIFF